MSNPDLASKDNACTISTFSNQGEIWVRLRGEMTLNNCDRIKQRVLALLGSPVETLYLNLSDLAVIDSAGLGVLVGLHMTARKQHVVLKLVSPPTPQLKLMEATRLTSVLTIVVGPEAEQLRARLERPEYATDPPADSA